MEHQDDNKVNWTAGGEPILDQFSADGFIDCTFRISRLQQSAGRYTFHLSAAYHEEVVGFDVSVVADINSSVV